MNPPFPHRLAGLRAASRGMLDAVPEHDLTRQSHAELSPLLWHVGHVFFVEHYWLAECVFGDHDITDHWRTLYFPELCAKGERSARLPDPDAMRDWTRAVAARSDAYWAATAEMDHALLTDGYLEAFVRQHYAQHLETMRLACDQLALGHATRPAATALAPASPECATTHVPAHTATIGTDDVAAYDNEKPAFETRVAAFDIADGPVTNAQWLGFMEAGGYYRPELWDAAGWAWREAAGVTHPQHWRPAAGHGWHVPGDGEDAIADIPVHGIGWYEARAFARYAGARLPTEIEWEAARRADCLRGLHRVWEWCADAFHPYPGFTAFPYEAYSQSWFDGDHFVARGGSRHTEPDVLRPGFRNFYPPAHRHVRAGLRLAF